jgi:hypothetical protein
MVGQRGGKLFLSTGRFCAHWHNREDGFSNCAEGEERPAPNPSLNNRNLILARASGGRGVVRRN